MYFYTAMCAIGDRYNSKAAIDFIINEKHKNNYFVITDDVLRTQIW